ncbi:IS256 family transposase [Nannocystis punicea]|uniref:Mutator family transposase n=1 Tax=Nannocystis punicea TaxID=2995304 RepID=A0ABY7GY42_9BACT|nr:IS256 family transposase [Nannocystis poenicansa]WAS91832.1 IS256 family transposase [Nannocystis poenicansa]
MTKSARKSPRNEVEIVAPATRQLTMPLPELLHEELYGAVTRLGLVALSALLQQEVEELCGPRYARGMGDRPSRNGTTAGSLALGGRRVEVQRPRVRKDGKEVNLATWDRLASEDPLNRRAVEQMLIGVSTRKYGRSLETVPEDVKTRGTSKSAVSRRFVAATGAELDRWLRRDLSELALAAIMIDGIYIDQHVVLIALGFDETGAKHVLGVQEGATENRESCTALLRDLAERGLDTRRSTLFVIDGAKAMRRAILDVFGKRALIQRCQVHKVRNVVDHLPEQKKDSVRKVLREALGATTAKTAKRRLEALAGSLASEHPSAAASVREGLDELFTVKELGLPDDLVRSLSTTNAIENVNNGIRRIAGRVKRWRGGSMILRWIGVTLHELQRGFHRIKGCRGMKDLVTALRTRDAQLDPPIDVAEKVA